ncbi:autophagy protein 13 [Sporothrix epigloea]|uniref:Autophagy-related protein 13 n=1 Tax=Sporothrix epigloea TaxID=1892477 RepID=A0ABP0D9R2_9PEZI
MHQQSRNPPRSGQTSATSPQTNPTRTNNPRDALASRSRATSEATPPGPSLDGGGGDDTNTAGTASATSPAVGGPTKESIKKLDQIIQNFHLKAAVLIIQSRIPVTPSGGARPRKTNKWFQIETDDIDDFKDELKTWKYCGGFENRPPPMIIETYLDASRLATGQALVVIDENGKRWDALEALNSSDLSQSGSGSSSSGRSDSNKIRSRSTEIILERWKVELKCIPSLLKGSSDGSGRSSVAASANVGGYASSERGQAGDSTEYDIEDFGPILPTIYKRSIIYFRSLFVTTHVLPAYRFSRQASTKSVHPALKVRCRVLTGADAEARIGSRGFDNLRQPLHFDNGRDVVTDYMFGDLEVPIGRFSASVTYRNDCSFRIDDSESLLSSRFMGIDENYFRPSLPQSQRPDSSDVPLQRGAQQSPGQQYRRRDPPTEVVGSLPSHHRSSRSQAERLYQPQPRQTYGSLSTFHVADALGTSPISALKAVRTMGSDTSSPTNSYRPSSMEQRPQIDPPNSLPITAGRHGLATGSSPKSSIPARVPLIRNQDGSGRRTSVSFQPFKAGSLSGSPRTPQDELPPSSSPLSGSRPTSGLSSLAQARNRSSLTAGMAASLRGAPQVSTSVGSASAAIAAITMDAAQNHSPRLAGSSRYSSSFTHRRGRSSFGGASRNEDDQGSSGKQSLASSMMQPGSGLFAEMSGAGSSGSFHTDDDNISEFLKALESKKTLQSFEISSKRGEVAARRTAAQLSRFQLMRESNVALTDSMNSSMQLTPRSPGSLSRQISGPSTLGAFSTAGNAAANISTSLSPSSHSPMKPLSPITSHAPHTPAVPSRLSENAIIDYQGQARMRSIGPRPLTAGNDENEKLDNGGRTDSDAVGGTTAINIPLSPRLHQIGGRRSSSAVQKSRARNVDDDKLAKLAAFITQRSLSVGADDREPPPPGTMFRLKHEGPVHHGSGSASVGDSVDEATTRDNAAANDTASSSGLGDDGSLKAAAVRGFRPANDSTLSRVVGTCHEDAQETPEPSATTGAGAVAAALRSTAGSIGASPRRRYMSRYQSATQQVVQQQQGDVSSSLRGSVGSEGRPTPPQMSRGSISSSFMGRYSGGGSGRGSGTGSVASGLVGRGSGGAQAGTPGASGGYGEADDEPLVFDLSELGRDPSRRSMEEAHGASSRLW